MRILVVEDFAPLRRSLTKGLREAGYAVDAVADGFAAVDHAETGDYDAIVLDLMLPGLDGFAVLERLRAARLPARVLILTARDALEDRVRGLDLGADDYLAKPFAFAELAARLRALLRRRYGRTEPRIQVGDLEIDTTARRVRRAGRPIEFTAREYALLELLAFRAGEVVTRGEIAQRLYDLAAEPGSNVIDVYIGYLRRKLEAAGGQRLLHTRRGQGYLLAGDE